MIEYIVDNYLNEDEMFLSSDNDGFDFGHFRLEEESWFNWLRLYGGACRFIPVVVGEED